MFVQHHLGRSDGGSASRLFLLNADLVCSEDKRLHHQADDNSDGHEQPEKPGGLMLEAVVQIHAKN